MLQLNTAFRVIAKKWISAYVILTAAILNTLQARGSRWTSIFVLDAFVYKCTTGDSLGGEIVISKASNHVVSSFTLYLNYGTVNAKALDFQWKEGADRLVIPVFFPQLVDSKTGAYAPTFAGSGVNLALTGIPASVAISYSDRSHEILAGVYDPVAELCKMCPNITSDWS